MIQEGQTPVAFGHDCREGICRACRVSINGVHRGSRRGAACQLYMRNFQDGDTIYVEPFRSGVFPIAKDLIVDRSALDRDIAEGRCIGQQCGIAADANNATVRKKAVDQAVDGSGCIGGGACAVVCPSGYAALFTAAKVGHLGSLPQGNIEIKKGFSSWSNKWIRKGSAAALITMSVRQCVPPAFQPHLYPR